MQDRTLSSMGGFNAGAHPWSNGEGPSQEGQRIYRRGILSASPVPQPSPIRILVQYQMPQSLPVDMLASVQQVVAAAVSVLQSYVQVSSDGLYLQVCPIT